MGAALIADRLVRCNAGATHYHEAGADGRLLDPADGPPVVRSRPEVPPWLLPLAAVPPFPVQAVEAQPLDLNWRRRKTAEGLLEYAAFADALAIEGDCWRAETEYKRVAFLAEAGEVDRWALMKTGSCYYRWKQWTQSAASFEGAVEVSSSVTDRNVARFMAAASYFNEGRYAESAAVLRACTPTGISEAPWPPAEDEVPDRGYKLDERIELLGGLCSMASGDWGEAALHFDSAVFSYPDSPNHNQAQFMAWKSQEGESRAPQKHPALAASFSVVPGMGQLYAGRYFDGFRHLLVDGLLMVSVYQLFKSENYAAGYLLAGFTLPFYVGNIIGARDAAESYNATRRAEYVSDVIDEAGSR